MNPDARDKRANAPSPPDVPVVVNAQPQPTQHPGNVPMSGGTQPVVPRSPGGNSTLKIVVPIVVLMAVVFGITFFAQYSPNKDDEKGGSAGTAATLEPPLRFGSLSRRWDPVSSNLQDRVFPGFYEPGETLHSASFWFENRNPGTITMQMKEVSCQACSGARLAPIPNEVTRQLIQTAVVTGFPQGLISGLPIGMIAPSSQLEPTRLQWQEYSFRDTAHPQYRIPAADTTDKWSPSQWGILELRFRVDAVGPKPLTADFAIQKDGTQEIITPRFGIAFEGVNPFELSRTFIDVGELTETSEARKSEFLIYSMTRGPDRIGPDDQGDLTPPRIDVRMPGGSGDPGPFVTTSPPVRVPEADLIQLSKDMTVQLKKFVRIDSAYRVTVTVTPRVGNTRIDVGLLERDVLLAGNNVKEPRHVRVKGMVRGPIWLDNDRTDFEVPAYKLSEGISLSIKLITEQPDAIVSVLAGECGPSFAKITLEKLPPAVDRGYYSLKVSIPKNGPAGSWNGVIVLELKGPTPRRIRIPLRGRATF